MERELCATVGADEHTVFAEPLDDGRWKITIDGGEHLVDAREIRPGMWSLLVDGRSWVIDLDARKTGLVALAGEHETPILLEDARRKRLVEMARRNAPEGAAGDTIVAPIAGKVVKVLVEAGAEVVEGQGLLVLEAMKMENEIKAPRDATVKQVHVAAGQSVETQEPLLSLE